MTSGGLRQATGTFSRRRAGTSQIEGAPYKPQDLVVNRYLIKDIVGVGPLGFVFRAHDKELDVEVALKSINPKLLQSADERKHFAKHIRLGRKLSHPNLARVYEEGEDEERPFVTSQFLDGLSLRKIIDLRLQKGQFFALGEIEPILTQICAALEGAHKVGPHSDLKPDNVLVLPDLLKVTDFGMGLAMPRLPYVQAMKARKAERYLAPELVEGNEIDIRADIYSVGVILGEMLSGLTPDGSVPELQRRNPEVPQQLEGIYRKAVNANPNARFKTADDLLSEVTELSKKLSGATSPKVIKPESASGLTPIRPRTTTGAALQLTPRREAKTVPLTELPPPPPPISAEMQLPDSATAQVDSAHVRGRVLNTATDADFDKDREETDVIDSGMYIAQIESDELLAADGPPQKQSVGAWSFRTWVLVGLTLLISGVGLGGSAGYFFRQKQRAQITQDAGLSAAPGGELDVPKVEAETKVVPDDDAAQKAEAERLEAARLAAEKEQNEKLEAERQSKAAAEKLAAEKAAALLKERTDAEKAAKMVSDKAAVEKQPVEKKADKTVVPPVAPVAGCPDGMRLVAGGAFKMGTAAGDPMMGFDEKPQSSVEVAAFCVDTYEFPNKRGVAPTTSVGFADAKRLCEAQGKRLCSEAEWEKSCKGPGGAKWPYGNGFDANSCNTEDEAGDARSLAPSGRFPKCRSGFGVADLAGNVAEWTDERTIKGGSFASGDYAVRCSARKNGASFAKSTEVGFRCCAEQR